MGKKNIEIRTYKVKKDDEVIFQVILNYNKEFIEAVANKIIEIAEKKKENEKINEVLRDLIYGKQNK